MLKRAVLAVCLLIFAGIDLGSPAHAGLRVCNRSGQRIDLALGYPDKQSGWTAQGWWRIAPGQCREVVAGKLTNRYYYLYATGSGGGVWQATGSQRGGYFCIRRKRFILANRGHVREGVLDCAAHEFLTRQFLVVDTGGAPDHVHDLKD